MKTNLNYEATIKNAKSVVLSRFQPRLHGCPRLLRLALNEAEALAWETGYPALVFPELAAEKAKAVAEWHNRQNAVRDARPPLALAA